MRDRRRENTASDVLNAWEETRLCCAEQKAHRVHLIENFFAKLKQFRAIATRYDKTARNFLAAIHLTAGLIWLN